MGYAAGKIADYLADAASDKPAPGGGSVSALAGALAASMGEMAANFTTGRKKFKDVQPEISQSLERLTACRAKLLALMDADVGVYQDVSVAYGMPKGTEQESAARAEAIQNALQEAMKVPLSVMLQCAVVSEIAACLVRIANPNLITDVGVSAILAEAACAAAALNVEVNLKFIKDPAVAQRVRPEIAEIIQKTAECRGAVERAVHHHLSR